jgi:integrase
MKRENDNMIDLRQESHAIPFPQVKEAIDYMVYGCVERVMFLMLALTGCRLVELDRMSIKELFRDDKGYILFWKLGKNQKGNRRCSLPDWYIKELLYYRQHNRIYNNRLFGVTQKTFTRYFNDRVRPFLSLEWSKKGIMLTNVLTSPNILQLKGLRKNFQTLKFWQNYKEWNSPDIALEMTSKMMKHSSRQLTIYHYIENFDRLGVRDGCSLNLEDLIMPSGQTLLADY